MYLGHISTSARVSKLEETPRYGWIHLLVYEEANQTARAKANDGRNGKGRGRKTQAHATNEDDRLETFTKDCDEGKDEHRVLLAPYLEPSPSTLALFGAVLGLERLCQLDAPLVLKLGHAE